MKAVIYFISVVLLLNVLTSANAGRCDRVACTYEAQRKICGVMGPHRKIFPEGSCQMRRYNCKHYTRYQQVPMTQCWLY